MTDSSLRPTAGAKMQFLIKRRAQTSRDELIAHWYANHMRRVIVRNERNRAEGDAHFSRYLVTLFSQDNSEIQTWDGVAQLWHAEPLARPTQASAVVPHDSFHEKVEPYWPWATQEWVIVEGDLAVEPLTLDDPFPCTRSGFVKQTSLVAARPDADLTAMFKHWLEVHAPNVEQTMKRVGGFRYVVSLSSDFEFAPYAGMAELYFPDAGARQAFWDVIEPDGFQEWVDPSRTHRFVADTEMIGMD